MPANDSFEFDYTPGYTKPTHEYGQPFGDEFHAEAVQELLFSTAGYTQRGVTLAGGMGVVPTGAVIARITSGNGAGLYALYQAGATDGRQNAVGVLRDGRDTGGAGGTTLTGPAAAGGLATFTQAGTATTYAASPSGKPATPCLGNVVIRGILNASLVSGTDSASLVSGTGGGVGTPLLTALGARVVQFGNGGGANFPGGPMDAQFATGSGVQTVGANAFIF